MKLNDHLDYTGLAQDEMREIQSKKTWRIKDNAMALDLIRGYMERENWAAAHETIELVRLKREKERR